LDEATLNWGNFMGTLQQLRFSNRIFRLFLFGCALVLATTVSPQVAQASNIEICKQTNPSADTTQTGFKFTHANGFGPLLGFTLQDGNCNPVNITGQDQYNKFQETVPSGWTLTDIKCIYKTSAVSFTNNTIGAKPHSVFQPGDNTVNIDQNEPNVKCTFVNDGSQTSSLGPSCVAQAELPTGATNVHYIDKQFRTGKVDQLYPGFDTSTDDWYPKYYASGKDTACPWDIGGTLPPREDPTIEGVPNPTALNKQLEAEAVNLLKRNNRIPHFPRIVSPGFQYVTPTDYCAQGEIRGGAFCTDLDKSPFHGKDIIYVHGLDLGVVEEALWGNPPPL